MAERVRPEECAFEAVSIVEGLNSALHEIILERYTGAGVKLIAVSDIVFDSKCLSPSTKERLMKIMRQLEGCIVRKP